MRGKLRLTTAVAIVATAWASALGGELRDKVDSILSSKDLAGAAVGVRILDAESGRVLYSYHSDDVLSAASNAKVVTTAAALDLLGSKFELTTTLLTRGAVRNGVLYGDLVLVGKGDPSMSTHWTKDVMEPLRRFAREAASAGITAVTGDIVADDLYFDREFWCPSWPENQWIYWYQAPVSALAFNDNCVDVSVAPGGAEGAPAKVSYYPAVGYARLLNTIVTTPNKKKTYAFYRGKFDNEVTAKGYVYIKREETVDYFTVYDPALYTAAGLKAALEEAGIRVRGTTRLMSEGEQSTLSGAQVLAVNRITLGEAAKYCNVNSQNLYAEMILKTIGRESVGKGSFAGGAEAVGRFLEKLGIPAGTYSAADGSGLSRETKYSAKILTEVLRHMYTSKEVEAFRDSLPLAGYDGTMEERLTDEAYRGKVRAKTGYILGASALSGYALTANGKTLAFSMIFNNFKGSNRYTVKPVQDNICRAMIDSTP